MIKVNGEEIKFTKFPNNETLVDTEVLNKYKDSKDRVKIEFKWFEDADILYLYFVLNHLKELNMLIDIDLYVYYMPYSRMDRSQNGNCFTLKYVRQLIHRVLSLDFSDQLYIVEPHSDVSLQSQIEYKDMGANINYTYKGKRVNVITPLMNKILEEHPEISVICYPDAGAMKRFKDDETKLPVVYCNKVRDFDTGEIKGLELIKDENLDLTGKNVLILDDLSSKGGTFYFTSLKLKEAGANEVYLGVCHCEYSIREGKIWSHPLMRYRENPIKHIYCTDSMLSDNQVAILKEGNMTIYDLEKFLKTKELVPNSTSY